MRFRLSQINPAVVVDAAIAVFLDVMVPGRGMGERNWLMKNWRNLEQSAEKASWEVDIRDAIRRWDERCPLLHHELIVRYVAGSLASTFVSAIFDIFRPPSHRRRPS